MLKIFWSFLILVAIALPLHAELYYEGGYNPNQTLQQQLAEDNPRYPRPIIFVFYDNNPCYECPQTIELIENIYNMTFTSSTTKTTKTTTLFKTIISACRWKLFCSG